MSSESRLVARGLDLSTLTTIKNAWSSPTACVKNNWCRIPSAVIIFLGLLFLFTFFCCCAQCLSCCCCRPRRSKRGFADQELGNGGHNQRLLPNSSSFGQSDLPAMPSFGLSELKKPTYAVIGDDGSVTTDDPEKRLKEDFPAESADITSPTYSTKDEFSAPAPTARNDMFTNANGAFHDNLRNQHVDTSYRSSPAAATYESPAYSPSEYRRSPPRRQPAAFDQSSMYSAAPPSFSTVPRPSAGVTQPQNYNTSRGVFNSGGPFPIIGAGASQGVGVAARPLPNPSAANLGGRVPPRFAGNAPTRINTDWNTPQSTPYPLESTAEVGGDSATQEARAFDPYANRAYRNNF